MAIVACIGDFRVFECIIQITVICICKSASQNLDTICTKKKGFINIFYNTGMVTKNDSWHGFEQAIFQVGVSSNF